MQAESDDALVRRAQAGDAEAFGALVLAHQQFVYNLAWRALADPHEAEDVAQEAFVRAWLALPNFRAQAQFRTWLYRIVTNLCYNRLPWLRRELTALGDTELIEQPDHSQTDPAAALESVERQAHLTAALDRLPEGYRLLLLLRFQQGLAYDEIALVTSLPLGTVKTGLHRARARLKEALRVYDEALVAV